MQNCGHQNVRKHREINIGKQYIASFIYLKFGNMDSMKSSEPKYYLVISGKGLITSLGLNIIRMSNKIKKSRLAVTEVSLKDISMIIKEF